MRTRCCSRGGLDYDAVWVVDSDGEFARALPYRTALPRPVVGDAGLTAQAWAPHFERFGAPQLARRFAKRCTTPDDRRRLGGVDRRQGRCCKPRWRRPHRPRPQAIRRALGRSDFTLDGFKGVRLGFRAWDRQLRQPLLLTDGQGVIATAPAEGVLHPKNVLDTLGADAPESACKAK